MTDFIGIYDNVLTHEQCQHLINKFETSALKKPGCIGSGVDTSKKDSLDIEITPLPEWEPENRTIAHATLSGLIKYARDYPFLLVGALATSIQHPVTGEVKQLTTDDIAHMNDEQLANIIRFMYRLGSVNIQQYKKGSGGYHHWHSEFYPHPQDPEQSSLHRVLLFSFYLNDVDSGGETEFFYQQRKVSPKTGRMIIAPATFTHTHKGHVPQSNDKYFMTSWILFQQAANLYPSPR